MKKEEVIGQLKELIEDRRSFMLGDYDECYDKDVQALEHAIKKLTAQEVPVQEQYKSKVYILYIILSIAGITLSIIGLLF